ncbi:hypothetical protein P43SY_006168 [Pythium insidiosum]|uniref:Uncharacterized protein n=1 Tax=Pythium insidiosum TaxID=114742 RepID=A0AAD5M095_PYTIN|nr:hypothetical protein P43SY_006168 [Pythium insidiosum]
MILDFFAAVGIPVVLISTYTQEFDWNYRMFPFNLWESWPEGLVLYMENAEFERIPDILLDLRIHYLNLAGNPIVNVDQAVFMASGLHLLVLSGTAISSLPQSVNVSAVSIYALYLFETNISALPLRMEDAEQLLEFMDVMASFTPTIPEELVEHYLHQVGFTTSDPRIVRMIALAAHKFVLDVSHDAMQCQRIRAQNPANPSAATAATATSSASLGGVPGGARAVLTTEDLATSLREYGVNLCKPEYYSDVAKEA